jgi:hypothetical protein
MEDIYCCIYTFYYTFVDDNNFDRIHTYEVLRYQYPLDNNAKVILLLPLLPISTKLLNLNPAHGEVNLIQHYVIKCVSDFRYVGGLSVKYINT